MFKEKQRKAQRVTLMATVDKSHRQHITRFEKQSKHDLFDYKNKLQVATAELEKLEKRRQAGETITDRENALMSSLRDKIIDYKQNLQRIESGRDELEYWGNNGDNVIAYYDITRDETSGRCWYNAKGHEEEVDDLDRLNQQSQHLKPKKPTERKVKVVKSASLDMRSFFKVEQPTGEDETTPKSRECKRANPRRQPGEKMEGRGRATPGRKASDSDIDNTDSDGDDNKEDVVRGILTGSTLHFNKAELADTFFAQTDPNYKSKINTMPSRKYCVGCSSRASGVRNEMVLDSRLSMYYCRECGDTEKVVMDTDRQSYKEPMSEQTMSPYKRINHQLEVVKSH